VTSSGETFRRARQWHPLFVYFFRPVVYNYYEVSTNMPVGDVPREADVVLLRRTTPDPVPFHGIWSRLTQWNILEFKGPTVSARLSHLDQLVGVGLGINRSLNTARRRQRLPAMSLSEVSFWYLVSHLGRRFLRQASQRLGAIETLAPGMWQSQVLGRPLALVSYADLPIDVESLPLHMLVQRSGSATALARVVAARPDLWEVYIPWLLGLQPQAWQEVQDMARNRSRIPTIDLAPIIEFMGFEKFIEQVGLERVIEQVGLERVIEQVGLERFVASLTPAQRQELKQRL
jgi:hypothetical protein